MAPRFRLIASMLMCALPQVSFGQGLGEATALSVKVSPGQVLARTKASDAADKASQGLPDAANQGGDLISELRFGGIESDGTIVLFSKTVRETLRSSTASRGQLALALPDAQSKVAVNAEGTTGNNVAGRAYAMRGATTSVAQMSKGPNESVIVPPDVVAMRLPKGTEKITFGDQTVEIIYAGPESLTYRLGAIAATQSH